ncbi:hypothetical protein QQF64_009018 [Cirrhinus molitorella]|uniref:Uncharacterized protein n=1 Tax=Cirrhinus molitorella TaxID=172907 RepID=A0ABR3MA81_9TELE
MLPTSVCARAPVSSGVPRVRRARSSLQPRATLEARVRARSAASDSRDALDAMMLLSVAAQTGHRAE